MECAQKSIASKVILILTIFSALVTHSKAYNLNRSLSAVSFTADTTTCYIDTLIFPLIDTQSIRRESLTSHHTFALNAMQMYTIVYYQKFSSPFLVSHIHTTKFYAFNHALEIHLLYVCMRLLVKCRISIFIFQCRSHRAWKYMLSFFVCGKIAQTFGNEFFSSLRT